MSVHANAAEAKGINPKLITSGGNAAGKSVKIEYKTPKGKVKTLNIDNEKDWELFSEQARQSGVKPEEINGYDLANDLFGGFSESAVSGALQGSMNSEERSRAAQKQMQAEIEAARRKQIEEDSPILSKLFPHLASSMAKSGKEGTLGGGNALASAGDAFSLPGRIAGATIDEYLNGQDWGESLGQTYGEADNTADGEERNIGGKMAQGFLRDPTTLPLAATGIGLAPKVLGTSPTVARTIGAGAGLGTGFGLAGGLSRPFLEGSELSAKDAIEEGVFGGIAGGALPALGTAVKKGLGKATLGRDKTPEAWRKRAEKYADRNFQDRKNPRNAELLMEAADDAKLAEMRKNYGRQSEIADDIADLKFIPEEELPGFEQWNEALGKSRGTIKPANVVEHLNTAGERIKTNPNVQGLIPEKEAAANSLGRYSKEFLGKNGDAYNFTAQELNQLKQDIGRVIDWDKLHPRKTDFETAELKKAYGMINDLIDSNLELQGLDYGIAGRVQMSDALQKRDALFKALRAGNDRNNIASNIDRNIKGVGVGTGATTATIEKRLKDLSNALPQLETLSNDLQRANQGNKLLLPNLEISNNRFITTGRDNKFKWQPDYFTGRNPKAAVDILRRTMPSDKPGFIENNIGAVLPLSVLGGASAAEEAKSKKKKRNKYRALPALEDE